VVTSSKRRASRSTTIAWSKQVLAVAAAMVIALPFLWMV
jgi:hypothetical protein